MKRYYASEDCYGPSYRPIHFGIHVFESRAERDGWVAADPDGWRAQANAGDARRCATFERVAYCHGDADVPRSWSADRKWWHRDPREWDADVHRASLQVFTS